MIFTSNDWILWIHPQFLSLHNSVAAGIFLHIRYARIGSVGTLDYEDKEEYVKLLLEELEQLMGDTETFNTLKRKGKDLFRTL